MSKRKPKAQKAKKKRKSPYSDHNISDIDQHRREGKKLSPPLNQLNMSNTSWADDHMPEMLWAVLLTESMTRNDYLACFRAVAVVAKEWFKAEEPNDNNRAESNSSRLEDGIDCKYIADLTTLAEVPEEEFDKFAKIIVSHPQGIGALRPLLLIEALPGKERWGKALNNIQPVESDWNTLANAVSGVLDHQSEESTDIRWFKLVVAAISGRMYFMESMSDLIEELRLFPSQGDMRRVRPFIRSSEIVLRRNPAPLWVANFWAESLRNTQCIDPSSESEYELSDTRIDRTALYKTRFEVIKHFYKNLSPKRVDFRLDASFGFVLYALALVEEIGLHRLHSRISGRLALRAIVEAAINFQYLTKMDSEELWKSFRIYGAGQAKLAFLKAQEMEGDLPSFLDEDALYSIANEDIWQEFLDIDVGHWAKANLRSLAEKCDAKPLYDKYYDWTSGYVHSQWGAVRDTNFITCHNPLHRLHRIPRSFHRSLASLEADVCEVVNIMLNLLKSLYPRKREFSKVAMVQQIDGVEDTNSE